MKKSTKQFFDKFKIKLINFFSKLKKWLVCACKFFDDAAHNRADIPFNLFPFYFLVACAIISPIIDELQYFNDRALFIINEIVFAFFTLFFILCTIIYHKKSIWNWLANGLLIAHYVTLIDIESEWNAQFGVYYLGLTTVFSCSWMSWLSAKDINKKGGFVDTILLAIGLALLMAGIISKNGDYQYYKYLIVAGIALIYLYAIARVFLQIFFSHNNIKIDLFKTMIYVVIYIALIVGLPFLLEYAGVEEEVLAGTIIPIYAAAVGGILTLAGVAWTIKHNQEIRQEDCRNEVKPFFGLLNNLSSEVVEANDHTYCFSTHIKDSENKAIVGNFVNTDKNCFILKKVRIGETAYTPDSQYLISKAEVFQIRIFEEDIPNDECIITLVVEDQNGNEWLYRLVKSGTYIISMKAQQGETNE